MGIPTTWQGASSDWNDPVNWSNGVPLPGDTAIIGVGPNPTSSSRCSTAACRASRWNSRAGALLSGTLMSLSHSTVTNTPGGGGTAKLQVGTLLVGAGSTVEASGNVETSPTIDVTATTLGNAGLLAASKDGALFVTAKSLTNTGDISALDGGAVYLENGTVSGGTITDNGLVSLQHESVGANTTIAFKGGAFVGLDLYAEEGQMPALIKNFSKGNFIEIDGFNATAMLPTFNFLNDTTSVVLTQHSGPAQALTFAGDLIGRLGYSSVGGETLITRTS